MSVKRLCRISVLAALSFILMALVKIKLPGNIHITLESLPIVVGILFFGGSDATIAAIISELLMQLLEYGLTVTTPLWLLPPLFRDIYLEHFCHRSLQGKCLPEEKGVYYYAAVVFGGLLTTFGNTLVIWLDSVIVGYYTFAYVFGSLLWRILIGIATSLLVAYLAKVIVGILRTTALGERDVK